MPAAAWRVATTSAPRTEPDSARGAQPGAGAQCLQEGPKPGACPNCLLPGRRGEVQAGPPGAGLLGPQPRACRQPAHHGNPGSGGGAGSRPASWRMETGKGARAGGDLSGLGAPCSSPGGSPAGFLSSQAAATSPAGTRATAPGTPPPRPTAGSQDTAVGTSHQSNPDRLSPCSPRRR